LRKKYLGTKWFRTNEDTAIKTEIARGLLIKKHWNISAVVNARAVSKIELKSRRQDKDFTEEKLNCVTLENAKAM
jgi:hypothetical protein